MPIKRQMYFTSGACYLWKKMMRMSEQMFCVIKIIDFVARKKKNVVLCLEMYNS